MSAELAPITYTTEENSLCRLAGLRDRAEILADPAVQAIDFSQVAFGHRLILGGRVRSPRFRRVAIRRATCGPLLVGIGRLAFEQRLGLAQERLGQGVLARLGFAQVFTQAAQSSLGLFLLAALMLNHREHA